MKKSHTRRRTPKVTRTDSRTASEAMQSLEGLCLGPIAVSEREWLYVEQQGVCVVHQVTNAAGAVTKTDQFYLPWSVIRRALAIRDKKKQPRKGAR